MKPHIPTPPRALLLAPAPPLDRNVALALVPIVLLLPISVVASAPSPPEGWRSDRELIDLHQYIDCTTQHLARAVKIMDAAGLGISVILSGGTVTRPGDGAALEFEQNKRLADAVFPGRFVQYMNLDYAGWDADDFSVRAVKQVEEGHRLGAAALKEFKRLGLYLRDGSKRLIRVDDPKLDRVWQE